ADPHAEEASAQRALRTPAAEYTDHTQHKQSFAAKTIEDAAAHHTSVAPRFARRAGREQPPRRSLLLCCLRERSFFAASRTPHPAPRAPHPAPATPAPGTFSVPRLNTL